jgi:hypothetical protein
MKDIIDTKPTLTQRQRPPALSVIADSRPAHPRNNEPRTAEVRLGDDLICWHGATAVPILIESDLDCTLITTAHPAICR